MPNWCSNTLKVSSDNAEKFRQFVESTVIPPNDEVKYERFTLDKLVPCPAELLDEGAFARSEKSEELVQKYGYSDWYSWRVANWGTKWDCSEAYIDEVVEGEELHVSFDTAWAPPIPWLITVGKMFPELRFSMLYEEPGCDFCGYYIIENGETIDFDEDSYEFYDEETGKRIEWNADLEKWVFMGTDEIVSDDDNYWPESHNPYSDMI